MGDFEGNLMLAHPQFLCGFNGFYCFLLLNHVAFRLAT